MEDITDSDLYLRYVLGEVDPDKLSSAPERHLKCNPVLSQFIVSPKFSTPVVDGPFGKAVLDARFVAEEEARVTAGYRRLLELFRTSRDRPIGEYPMARSAEQRGDLMEDRS